MLSAMAVTPSRASSAKPAQGADRPQAFRDRNDHGSWGRRSARPVRALPSDAINEPLTTALPAPRLRERRHCRLTRRLVAVGVRRNVHCLCSTTSAERSFSSAKAHSCDGHHIVAATATIISGAVAHLCAGYTPPLQPASNPGGWDQTRAD
jgi:hypothetical protein